MYNDIFNDSILCYMSCKGALLGYYSVEYSIVANKEMDNNSYKLSNLPHH